MEDAIAITSNNKIHHIFQFDPKVGEWIFPETMKYPLIWDRFDTSDRVDVIVENDKVFIFDSYYDIYDNGTKHRVIVLEPKSGRWEQHILPHNRGVESVTVIGGKIYIVGGRNQSEGPELQILAIDLDNNRSESLASMSCARENPGVISHDGKIFVFGGMPPLNSEDQRELTSCEVYHVKENRWETIADMPTRRKYVSVTELHGKLYVIGGHYEADNVWNNNSYAVECYDPEKNIWESLPDMELEKYGEAPAIGFNGKLFVGGGEREFDENDEENNKPYEWDHIETLNIRTSQWILNEVEDEGPYIKNMYVMHRKYLPKEL